MSKGAGSAAERYGAGPSYHELLWGHMEREGIEDMEELWLLSEERSEHLGLERETFELMYEGTWCWLEMTFFIGVGDALRLEESERSELSGAFIWHNWAKPHFLYKDAPPSYRGSERIEFEQLAERELRAAARGVLEEEDAA